MIEDHDCDTCKKKEPCEMRDALEACTESYATGVGSLAQVVAAAIDADIDEELKVIWLGIALEMVGLRDLQQVKEFASLVEKGVDNKDLYEEIKMECLMVLSNQVMGKAAALSTSIGEALGVSIRFQVVDGESHPQINTTVH